MSESTSANTAFAAFVAACGELSNPPKTSKVSAGAKTYYFAPLPEILDLVRPVLARHALAIRFRTAPDANNILVTCEVVHATGTVVSTASLYSPSNANMQVVGSGLTYARRYTLVAALGIAADDDDDGEATTRPAPALAPKPATSVTDPWVAFERQAIAHKLAATQIDAWRKSEGKPPLADLDASQLAKLGEWLFAPKQAPVRLRIASL